ncbi:MAG: hypothetical protein LBD23_13015 [Oscillospiraceae bacterium]|jgi:hypothetical protein|nr:hypothetical protein [Oscillospiraceae bacterium]
MWSEKVAHTVISISSTQFERLLQSQLEEHLKDRSIILMDVSYDKAKGDVNFRFVTVMGDEDISDSESLQRFPDCRKLGVDLFSN